MTTKFELCYNTNNSGAYPIDTNNRQALAIFRQDNPHIISSFIPPGTPFILRSGDSANDATYSESWRQSRPDLTCAFNHVQSLPPHSRRNIALMNEQFGGDNLQAIADFYQTELAPLIRSESIGAVGASATALNSRLSNFGKAASKLQRSLEAIRQGAKAKLPKHKMMILEQQSRVLAANFNENFKTELNKFVGRVKSSNRGAVFRNIDRGINKAISGRHIQPIQFTSARAFNNLRAFEKGAKFLGSKLIVIDAGVRAGEVHIDYLAGRNWQRRAAVETAGFGFGVAAGIAAGQATVGYLSIALLATPLGWVFIIGAALTVGFVAAKSGDSIGQWLANTGYDIGTWINEL